MPGVERVVEIPGAPPPSGFQPLGGVAVIASNTWAAMQGRQKLQIALGAGPNADYDTTAYRAAAGGDRAPTWQGRARQRRLDACTADGRQAGQRGLLRAASRACDDGAGVAAPRCSRRVDARCGRRRRIRSRHATTVAEVLGIDQSEVTVNVTLLGGGFGRKSKPDYVAEAALLARAVGAPVKVTWSREDDSPTTTITRSRRSISKAGWTRAASRSRGCTARCFRRSDPHSRPTRSMARRRAEPGRGGHAVRQSPNVRCENGRAEAHVRIGWYRSVYNIPHAFAVGSFVDELAAAAGKDPLQFLLSAAGRTAQAGSARCLAPDYTNYGASLEEYPIDIGRMRNVVLLAAARSGWGSPLPPRHGRGIAVHRSFLSYVAAVAHVAVATDGTVTVPRDGSRGGLRHGGEPRPRRGAIRRRGRHGHRQHALQQPDIQARARAEQSNFGDYQVARIDATPETHVYMVRSDAPPGRRW